MQNKTKKLMCYLVVALMLIVSAISVLGAVGNSGNSPYTAGTGVVRSDGGYPSNWSFSENSSGYPTGTLDEAWWFDVNANWGVENCSGYPYIGDQVQYTLTCNISDNTTYEYVSYALLNDSGMNRSQSVYWFKTNDSANEVFAGFIYNAISNDDWDGIFFGANEVYHLHWNGTGLSNVSGAQANVSLTTPDTWENHWSSNWGRICITNYFDEPQPWADNGSYVKIIYNAENDSVQAKIWGDSSTTNSLWMEPAGWCIDTNLTSVATNNRSIGFAVLNPLKKNVTVNFDMLQTWNLNSSLNHSATSYGSNPASNRRPHMDFPIINVQPLITDFQAYFNSTGNITADSVVDIARRTTNRFNLESRQYVPDSTSILIQNDTVYYYSAVISNFTYIADMFNVTGEYIPNNVLLLNIQQCADGSTPSGAWAFVAIDVDGNNSWDVNDRAWLWYYDGTRLQWNGTTFCASGFYAADNVTFTTQVSTRNLHRYNRHTQYTLGVDLDTLIKNNSASLVAGDVFRMVIITGNDNDLNVCSWNNWNETGNTPWSSNETHDTVKDFFLNQTTLTDSDLTINSTSIGRWGEGEIGDGSATVLSGYTGTNLDVEKVANITYITRRYAGTHRINYTIRLRNLQDTPLTNIYVNDSILRATNSDFNWTFVYATGTWTINNASGYMFWSVGTIAAGGYQNYTYVVDAVRNNGSSNYQLMPNTVYANCSQGVDDTDTFNIRWGERPATGFLLTLDSIMSAIYAVIYMIFILALIGLIIGVMSKIFK